MRKTFAELHDNIGEFRLRGFRGRFALFSAFGNGFEEFGILTYDRFVKFFLHGGHGYGDDNFGFRREGGHDVGFDTAQEAWPSRKRPRNVGGGVGYLSMA